MPRVAPVCLEYYELLGVRPHATRSEIRRRYQQLSAVCAEEGAAMRGALKAAGQVLTNKDLRYIYDRFGKNGVETFNSVRYETWSASDQLSAWLILVGGWSAIVLFLDEYSVFPVEW
jgi:DnaJ-class molecular chaperone